MLIRILEYKNNADIGSSWPETLAYIQKQCIRRKILAKGDSVDKTDSDETPSVPGKVDLLLDLSLFCVGNFFFGAFSFQTKTKNIYFWIQIRILIYKIWFRTLVK